MVTLRERVIRKWGSAFVALLLMCFGRMVQSDERSHRYEDKDPVKLWVNKVGPYFNPQETYPYYSLPFCKAHESKPEQYKEGLGASLEGNKLVNSGYVINFKEDRLRTISCSKILSDKDAHDFTHAIRNFYWVQMYIDDLPIWGMVGEKIDNDDKKTSPEEYYLYTRKDIFIGYNQDRIVQVNITQGESITVKKGANMTLSYSVTWGEISTKFSDRFDVYLDDDFFEHQVHWFSIFNSFMIVTFLVGLVIIILIKTLKKDISKYESRDLEADEDEMDFDLTDDSGWKQIHTDVFRPPANLSFFCALVGTGSQMIVLVLLLILISIFGTLYRKRGSITTSFIVSYALTSFIGGFVSGSLYMKYRGVNWTRNLVFTVCLFPCLCFTIGLLLNIVSYSYKSLATIPLGTAVVVILIWGVISFPLTVGGALIGRKMREKRTQVPKITNFPRPIPDKKWYMQPMCMILFGGILPFGSIYVEMYFIFTSFWNYKFYYVYGFMLLIYAVLLIVTVCMSVVTVFFLLNAEDYRWPWISFLSSASTAIYAFVYAMLYFVRHTQMSGFFQTFFYFGHVLLFCAGLAILCGTIGFAGAWFFVHRIYQNIKVD